jgi:microcystin-dependent protein
MRTSRILLALVALPLAFLSLDRSETQAAPAPSLSVDPMIGEVQWVAFNFAPRGWAMCDGQLLPISQYSALFSLLGTTYGGDGRTTFALPDLRGRAPLHQGTGPGLTPRSMGQRSGSEMETLNTNQVPSHTHAIDFTEVRGDETEPNISYYLGPDALSSAPADMELNVIQSSGGSQAHNNMQPYVTLNAVIALQGVFPSRN